MVAGSSPAPAPKDNYDMEKAFITIIMAILAAICLASALIEHSIIAGLPGIILTTFCVLIIFDINSKKK